MGHQNNYAERLQEYLEREVHPETARNIGRIVWSSPIGSAEFAMSIILQMQLDHVRQDQALQEQGQAQYTLADREGEALPPVVERTEVAQEHFANRFNGVQ